MKNIFISVLAAVLGWLSRGIIHKYQPTIIGVTGSVGKSSTKEAIYAVLKDSLDCRVSHGNLNNELGFPLSIIGDYEDIGSGVFWLKAVKDGIKELFFGSRYPKILILEYGADKPGDIDYLTGIARPDIAVVTSISKTPVHVEHYSSPQAVALEKGRLVKALSESGTAILNADDDLVARMVDDFDGKTLTYGMEGADVRIVGLSNVSEDGRPLGINFKLETLGKLLPVGIKGSFGRGQAYASAAALAVASTLGVNLIRASEKLSEYKPLPGRMNLIRGIRDSWLLDDSYNASPIAMEDALNTLKSLKAKRKVAILGDMKELGKYSDDAHRKMGKIITSSADILLAVGEKGKVMADSARASGMDERNIHVFDSSDEAKVIAGDIVSSGDLVLIKGSQSMRMERVAAEIMAEPSRAKELLPRQYGNWLDR